MFKRVVLIAGVLLLFAGMLGFLASSVGLATANSAPDVKTPKGVEITLAADDPVVRERQRQAEAFLFGSLLCGACGMVLTGMGVWLRKKDQRWTGPPRSVSQSDDRAEPADRHGDVATTAKTEPSG